MLYWRLLVLFSFIAPKMERSLLKVLNATTQGSLTALTSLQYHQGYSRNYDSHNRNFKYEHGGSLSYRSACLSTIICHFDNFHLSFCLTLSQNLWKSLKTDSSNGFLSISAISRVYLDSRSMIQSNTSLPDTFT